MAISSIAAANRERWLANLTKALKPAFKKAGAAIPDNLRITCGWPSRNGAARKKRVLGECWPPNLSADNVYEVFVSPVLDDPVEVAVVLAAELAHAACGPEHDHRYANVVRALGMGGKPSAPASAAAFEDLLEPILEDVGEYPHGALKPRAKDKTQTTRLKKVECQTCGYTARVTRKWLNDVGPPYCPLHGRMDIMDPI